MNRVSGVASGSVPPVVTGPGSLDRLAGVALRHRCRTVVLIVDEAVVASGYADRVAAAGAGFDVAVHVTAAGEPSWRSVDEAADAVRAAPAPLVVGVGGGSALDTAKQAAVVSGATDGVEHYALARHPWPSRRPIVAIPTTAGTGSEVTRTCVVTDRAGRKVWTWGEELLPDLVVLDPVACTTMPAHVTTSSGLDAFVHAMEAVTGRRTGALVAAPALHALRLVLDHLPAAVQRGDDLIARQVMQEAALLAGIAIDGGGTGIAHAAGHALGTLAHVPHGVAVAVALAAAMTWNVAGAPDAFTPVARSLGIPASDLPGTYAALVRTAGLPAAVGRVGALDVDADDLARAMVAEENLPMYRNNCRLAGDDERTALAAATLDRWHELLAEAPQVPA